MASKQHRLSKKRKKRVEACWHKAIIRAKGECDGAAHKTTRIDKPNLTDVLKIRGVLCSLAQRQRLRGRKEGDTLSQLICKYLAMMQRLKGSLNPPLFENCMKRGCAMIMGPCPCKKWWSLVVIK